MLLDVENLHAFISLNARLANLLQLTAGADASIDKVSSPAASSVESAEPSTKTLPSQTGFGHASVGRCMNET